MRTTLTVSLVLFGLGGIVPAQSQQLLSNLTASQCASRGGQITTWTNTDGSGPNVGDCYVAPRVSSGGGSFNTGGGGGRVGAALGVVGAALGFLDALGGLLNHVPSNDDSGGTPQYQQRYDYTQTPEYQEELRERAAHAASMDQDTDDLKAFVQSAPKAKKPTEADRCSGYAPTSAGLAQCYKATASVLEGQAANCSGSCRATMLRAAASARCVAAVGPGPATLSSTIAQCGANPAVGLQRVAATSASQTPPVGSTPQAPGATQPNSDAKPGGAAPSKQAASTTQPSSSIKRGGTAASQQAAGTTQHGSGAKPGGAAPLQQASAQNNQSSAGPGNGLVPAPGYEEECAQMAQNSVERMSAYYGSVCLTNPASNSPAKSQASNQPARRNAACPNGTCPSPLTPDGCGWYGGILRPDGSCWVMGATTNDCLDDLHGYVTESHNPNYKYCVIGGPGSGGTPATVPASPPAQNPPTDAALDKCREGSAAPWTIAGCYDLLGQPAPQNRADTPSQLRDSLRAALNAYQQAYQQAKQQAEERAEEDAAQYELYRDWEAAAVRRYDRWAAGKHPLVAENTAARDACTGRWVYDGTSGGSCDPSQPRARWELAFETRQPPSQAEAQRVADSGLPWRTNSETDCRNAGGIPVRPSTDSDITGLPPQLLADPTVDQAALMQSWMCYQTLGGSD